MPAERITPEPVGHEFDFIEWVRAQGDGNARVPVGIGDDAAVVRFPAPGNALVTVDMLMEGTDFLIPPATGVQIGRKALAVNLSDIAAMAGKPVACVVSVALPRRGGFLLGRELYAGIRQLADEFGVALAGGDTNAWDGPLVVSITVFGDPTDPGPVRRSGARPGDWIMATGDFGGSISGKQFDFVPRVKEAQTLQKAVSLHAMIDVSDGLAADLHHILDESRVGAILDAGTIPISASALAASDGRSPLDHALGDGEDFELLFTVSPEDGQKLLDSPPFTTRLTHLGKIVPGRSSFLRTASGTLQPLPRAGWTHGFDT